MDLQATNGRILSLCKEEIVKTEKIRDTRSQEAIRKAVLSLARHKPVEKISITEICREASVHRSTFYKYYGCQSDVVKDMLNRLILHTADHVMASLRGGQQHPRCPGQCAGVHGRKSGPDRFAFKGM